MKVNRESEYVHWIEYTIFEYESSIFQTNRSSGFKEIEIL